MRESKTLKEATPRHVILKKQSLDCSIWSRLTFVIPLNNSFFILFIFTILESFQLAKNIIRCFPSGVKVICSSQNVVR